MATHTPGPWFCDKDANDSLWIVGNLTTWVPRIAKVPAYFDMPNEANARLIAASPEMLAILKSLEMYAPDIGVDEFHDALRAARVVIAKAEA